MTDASLIPFSWVAWAVCWTVVVAVAFLCGGYLMGRQTKDNKPILEPVRRVKEYLESNDDPGGDIFREAMGEEDW